MRRVGFIINSRVPELASLREGMPPHALLKGWDDRGSPMSFMRFRWVSEALAGSGVRYEIYRPWRRYDAVVFMKSMGAHCMALARRLRERGTRIVFEANVDYYTRFTGEARLDAMVPTERQRVDAEEITRFADFVIGSSRHLAAVCADFNPRTTWIPDNVNLRLAPPVKTSRFVGKEKLNVWWSGMASKVFEFLAAESAFLERSDRIHLHLVTDDLKSARNRWPAELAKRTDEFLGKVPHTIHAFRDIRDLLAMYGRGGVIVSPRFLDVPYNLAHTEWKITLGMAMGLPAIASPVPSYRDVRDRAGEGAVTLCETAEDWRAALGATLDRPREMETAGAAAREVVEKYYQTSVVAAAHATCVGALFQ